jgi:hypothetical protein
VLSMECQAHFLPRQGGNFCQTGTFCLANRVAKDARMSL